MTDQQPHTPTSKRFKRVRDLYGMATAWNSHDTRPHVVRIREKNYAEFDQMIAEVIAAAEQRGAEKAFDEAVEEIASMEGNRLIIARYKHLNPYRADQMEGDDGDV